MAYIESSGKDKSHYDKEKDPHYEEAFLRHQAQINAGWATVKLGFGVLALKSATALYNYYVPDYIDFD